MRKRKRFCGIKINRVNERESRLTSFCCQTHETKDSHTETKIPIERELSDRSSCF